MSAKRFTNIDVVRGIAAMLVVLQHSSERTNMVGPDSIFAARGLNLGQMGVIAFFLVSGFVIPLSLERGKSLSRFALNRALRIYPLYVFVFALSCIFLYGAPSIKAVVAQLAFASQYLHTQNYVANSWTLSIEAIWYVLFAGLYFIGRNRSTLLIAFGTVAAVLAACAVKITGIDLPMGRICMLATCVMGMFTYRRFVEGEQCKAAMALVGLAIAIGLYVGFETPSPDDRVAMTLQGVTISWLAAYTLFFGSFAVTPPPFLLRVLKKLGEISYSLYLVHTFALYGVLQLGLSGIPYILAVVVTSIAAAFITFNFIEMPAIRLGHRWPRRDTRAVEREPTAAV